MTNPTIIEDALQALKEFRQAFVTAVGDKSPFAKQALLRADAALVAIPHIEAAALERAALLVDEYGRTTFKYSQYILDLAAAIRALKEQP